MLPRWAARSSQINPLAIYAIAYAAAAATQKGIGFVLIFWLAQALLIEEYARFGLLFALQSGVAMLAGSGILDSVIGLLKNHEMAEARAQLFSGANGVLLQLGTLTVILSGLGYLLFFDSRSASVATLIAVLAGGVLLAYFNHQATLVRLDERHSDSLLILLIGPSGGYIGAFAAFAAFRTAESFFFGMAPGLIFGAAVLRVAGVGFFGASVSAASTAAIRRGLIPYILIAMLGWLSGYGNTYIVKLLFESGDVAKFTFLFTLSSIMHLVATSTNQVWSPRFFRLVHSMDRAEIESRNTRFYSLQGGALGVAGAFLLLAYPFVISVAGGNLPAYEGLEAQLFLLFAGYAVSVPWWHAQNYFLAFGQGAALMRAVFITSVLGLLIWVVLMVVFGSIGIYLGFFVQMVLRSVWVVILASRRWGLRLAWRGPALALAVMSGGLYAVRFFGETA